MVGVHQSAALRTALLLGMAFTALHAQAQLPSDIRLFDAIAAEDQAALATALHNEASLGSHNRYGYTPLTAAAMQGNEHIVETLLQAGAEIDAPDKQQWTALIVASQQNQIDVAQVLLAHHADIDSTDRTGRSAIFYAVRRDHKMLQLLLSAHPSLSLVDRNGYTVLGEAYSLDDYDQTQLLVHAGAKFAGPLEELFAASATGDVARIQALLAKGTKVNDYPANAMTPLMIAAWHGNTAAVRILLAAGANPNVFDSNRQNALYWSFASKHLSTVEAVLGASPDFKLLSSRTALHLAAGKFDESDLIRRLLGEGVPIDALDVTGDTALMTAVQTGHRKATDALIAAHADLTIRNKQGLDAADLAAKRGDRELAARLDTLSRSPQK